MLKSIPMRRVTLLAVLTVLVLGGVASLLIFAPSRSAAQGGSGGAVTFACDHPPPEIFGWPIVKEIMQESGCFPEEAACWTKWIAVSNPRAWYEGGVKYRVVRFTDVGGTEPPGFFTPYDIADPRASCDVDCDGKDELAAGIWYVNLMARPSMPYYKLQGGVWKTYCDWRFDYAKYYWFFGERDTCKECSCWDIEPTAAPSMTAKPKYTACIVTPLPTEPTQPPPELTPIPEPPIAVVIPWADVRAPSEPEGVWHRTGRNFYWLWQTPLAARLGASASVGAPAGCEWATVQVFMTYLQGVNGQNVCPSPFARPRTQPNPANVLYPPEGWDEACVWRGLESPVNLLWSKNPMAPSERASWNNYGVTPFTQDWIELDYKVWLWVTYSCNGFVETVPQFQDLTLRVGLVKPVQPLR